MPGPENLLEETKQVPLLTSEQVPLTDEELLAQKSGDYQKDNPDLTTYEEKVSEYITNPELAAGIQMATNYSEIYEAIDKAGGIHGYSDPSEVAQSYQIKQVISAIGDDESKLKLLPRTDGLREKVRQLIENKKNSILLQNPISPEAADKDNVDQLDTNNSNPGRVESKSGRQIAIEASNSFEQLLSIIEQSGPIQGSELYSPADLKTRIESVKNGLSTEFVITETEGLRAKVVQLMEADPSLTAKLEQARKIRGSKNFEDLYSVIEQNGGVQSGNNLYSPSYLKNEVKMLQMAASADPEGINRSDFGSSITRAGGLRDKVIDLIRKSQ